MSSVCRFTCGAVAEFFLYHTCTATHLLQKTAPLQRLPPAYRGRDFAHDSLRLFSSRSAQEESHHRSAKRAYAPLAIRQFIRLCLTSAAAAIGQARLLDAIECPPRVQSSPLPRCAPPVWLRVSSVFEEPQPEKEASLKLPQSIARAPRVSFTQSTQARALEKKKILGLVLLRP